MALKILVKYHNLKTDGINHRALADAAMTSHLWMKLIENIKEATGLENVSFEGVQKLTSVPKSKVTQVMSGMREIGSQAGTSNCFLSDTLVYQNVTQT